jgi:hypothetical protein
MKIIPETTETLQETNLGAEQDKTTEEEVQ